MRYNTYIVISLAFWAICVSSANAQILNQLETLVMPGPLTADHAEYENNCNNCHSPLDKTRQNTLCIECHKEVGADVNTAKGFHGINPIVATSECSSCHTDHEGRTFDIVGFVQETFNHDFTDFPLTGGHLATQCAQCHVGDQKFTMATSTCISCHTDDDIHRGSMGENCSDCHATKDWQQVKFDHSLTKFPLEGGHVDIACSSCHADTRYTQTPRECVSCHIQNDEHEGRFGTECETCHIEQRWTVSGFDHSKYSDFLLRGKHQQIDCEACHTSTSPLQEGATACADCHASVDIHRGQNGTDCASCHSENNWTTTSFDHNTDTKFALTGAHQSVTCYSCHRGDQDMLQLAGAICVDCHLPDDVHKGQLGTQCSDCHTERNWNQTVAFDHDLTSFPLVGLHSIVACSDCHVSQEFAGLASECSSCHIEEDTHKNTLGNSCADCHNPNGWGFWQFDHNTQSDFKLDGAHTDLACAACHTIPVTDEISMKTDCASCHAGDDIHRGRFGDQCEQCHITSDFKTIRMQR